MHEEEMHMEVKLIAMTDVMYENEPAGSVESAEYVCNHAAKTCTKELTAFVFL